MDLNQGRFLPNGRCGYILKPSFMCSETSNFNPENTGGGPGHNPTQLTIKVSCGQLEMSVLNAIQLILFCIVNYIPGYCTNSGLVESQKYEKGSGGFLYTVWFFLISYIFYFILDHIRSTTAENKHRESQLHRGPTGAGGNPRSGHR